MDIIVCGFSPRIHDFPEEMLANHFVLGVNKTPDIPKIRRHLNAYINWDSHLLEAYPACFNELTCPKYLRGDMRGVKHFFSETPGDYHFYETAGDGPMPLRMRDPLKLKIRSSVATAACNLAYLLEANRIILAGIDFVGDKRADGSFYKDNLMEKSVGFVNEYFRDFPIRVCKTYKESRLELPWINLQ